MNVESVKETIMRYFGCLNMLSFQVKSEFESLQEICQDSSAQDEYTIGKLKLLHFQSLRERSKLLYKQYVSLQNMVIKMNTQDEKLTSHLDLAIRSSFIMYQELKRITPKDDYF